MAAKSSDLLASFEAAVRAERDARDHLREAMHAQGEILRDLRAGGVASTIIALRLVRVLELPRDLVTRKRVAAMLRSRTRRHSFLQRRDGDNGSSGVPLDGLDGKETLPMAAKLLRRTVVTEVFGEVAEESDPSKAEEELDERDEPDEEVDDDEDGEDDGPARRTSPHARRSR